MNPPAQINTTEPDDAALQVLSHPLALKAAWMRVDDWYRTGNLAPEPELSRWRLHPEAELRNLGSALRDGTWKPSRWPQIPYPKRGACLRHYVMPTVRDQVAFMVFLVLLGPLLDNRVPNFVFGNRWNRRIVWDRRRVKPQWVLRPYQLLDRNAYQPYARSHGLFRRVAHWTVARVTGAKIAHEDYGGHVHPEDYDASTLPPWIGDGWWSPARDSDSRAYWAALDIELAYPSIRLRRLRQSLTNMLRKRSSVADLIQLYGGYPQPIIDVLADMRVRQRIAQRLMDGLDKARVDAGPIPKHAWCPAHSVGRLPPDEKDLGLPTGLAISGIMLNVALHHADRLVGRHLHARRRGAIVRFADDIVVMAQSARGLFDLMETVWQGLSQDSAARLAIPETASNLHLNWSKIKPDQIREIVACFLKEYGWEECSKCPNLLHCSASQAPSTLGQWWRDRKHHNDNPDCSRMSEIIKHATIGPGNVGPFVTTLVTRMSELGRDTLADRFGEGARERLNRLHDLARFDIDDMQVRSDSRRAFAANRLVHAWLAQESERRDLADIRDSVAHVLRSTPWKFSLWRAVVRAAARRPQIPNPKDDQAAREWLKNQLSLIAYGADDRSVESWMNTWPEEDVSDTHDRDLVWRSLYLSFHRAAFGKRWRRG